MQKSGALKSARRVLLSTASQALPATQATQALREAPEAGTPALRHAGHALARAVAFAALGESSSNAWR